VHFVAGLDVGVDGGNGVHYGQNSTDTDSGVVASVDLRHDHAGNALIGKAQGIGA